MVTELKRVPPELDQTTNYQFGHLMAENKSLKENCDKIQKEYNCLEKSCDGWEDQIKRIEPQRDSARMDISSLQTRMDTDTTKIEKGVTDAEGKYNKLKQQYRALELS